MPERITIADGDELAFRERAMWLLLHEFCGGSVSITDEMWARVPERPELILDRADGVMRWTAQEAAVKPEPASLVAAELDPAEMPGQLPLPGVAP